ncbi:hypothetical protein B6U99_06745 [Candidatus Geothermarchaeota archaeon ex4572_27]|nr:MAG: hypothetical protein B6U99_06745 [Candidatus Geothermarchaeota archaeon ex4572_27]
MALHPGRAKRRGVQGVEAGPRGSGGLRWRLIDSGLVSGPRSAAIDEALLESRALGLSPNTLHFYRRRPPAVSIGRFQRVEEVVDVDECRRRGVDIVRRISGGGAIYTDEECLEYSIVADEGSLGGLEESFRLICGALARALRRLGVDARYKPVNDVLIGGRKVSGSAQVRRGGAVLQHGTILLGVDYDSMRALLKAFKLEDPRSKLTSLRAELGRPVEPELVKGAFIEELEGALGARFEGAGPRRRGPPQRSA